MQTIELKISQKQAHLFATAIYDEIFASLYKGGLDKAEDAASSQESENAANNNGGQLTA